MKFNFKKITAIGASALLTGMSIAAPIAAANYPAPFVVGGTANVAIVYGTGTGVSSLDLIQAGNIQSNLQSSMGGTTGTTTATATGGDSILLAKSSDNLNLGDAWTVFTGTIDDSDLSTLLADGTFIADDNDEFKYEQSITLGSPTLTHFRDSDYEDLAGFDTKTPVLGFKLGSNTFVMNYTLDFMQDAESDISGGDLEDIEGADLVLMGKTYYVSDFDNGTSNTYLGKLTLLDSANTGIVSEGETITMNVGDSSYEVSLAFISSSEVKVVVNGETTNSLEEGQSYKLSDGTYVGIKDITKLEVSGEIGSLELSLGSGKLEIQGDGSDIKLNDDTIQGVKGYTKRTVGTSGSEKIDSIVIEWKTDEEVFLTPDQELLMPGFGAIKFTMNEIIRPTEEKVTIDNDGDTSIELTVPIEDGDASFNILFSTAAAGNFTGIGKATDERLATSNSSLLTFMEKDGGTDYDKWFVATYATTFEAESYLLKATVQYNSGTLRNETDIVNVVTGLTVCDDYYAGKSCKIGDVSFTVGTVQYTSGNDEIVNFTAGTSVNFNTIYTKGGLKIYLPHLVANTSTANGGINFSLATAGTDGYNDDVWYLFMDGEDKEDTIAGGTEFNLTINNDGTTTNSLEVSQINHAGTGSSAGLEMGTGTGNYEVYITGSNNETAPRAVHYTKGDPDYAEVYYPTGDSETYAEVFIAESGVVLSQTATGVTGAAQLGDVLVKDSEVSSVSTKNLIVVGGSCINSAAATALGVSQGTCGAAFTEATGVGSGQFLIKGVSDAFTTGKIALVVAGYEAADTVNAATYLRNQVVDTSKEYKGTSSTSATMVTTEA